MKTQLGIIPNDPDDLPLLKDCVHVAVMLVKAKSFMAPGQHVIISNGEASVAHNRADAHGIVDPFLDKLVPQGSMFYALINPKFATNLRHTFDLTFKEELDKQFNDAMNSDDWCNKDC